MEYRKVIDIGSLLILVKIIIQFFLDLTAVIEGTRLAIKHMKRGGVVVNISSMAGLIPGKLTN